MESEQSRAYTEWKAHKESNAPTECRGCSEIETVSERGLCDRCEREYAMAEMDSDV